jgi:hypothetical protein
MFKTADIERLIRYVLLSGYIRTEQAPLSLMLVAPPESNKTSMLKAYENFPGVFYVVDLSGKPLSALLKDIDKTPDKWHHLIIPDYIKLKHHNATVVAAVEATINALIEEGVKKSLYFGQEIDLSNNIKMGLISSTTPDIFKQSFEGWNKIGMTSRMLYVCYEYSEDTVKSINNAIKKTLKIVKKHSKNDSAYEKNTSFTRKIDKAVKKNRVFIDIPDNISEAIAIYAEELVKELKAFYVETWRGKVMHRVFYDIQGFRLHKMLRLLSQSIAFDKNLEAVDENCLDELKNMLKYIKMPDKMIVL